MNLYQSLRAVAAVALALALSGCVVVPAYYPHYYRPYRPYYYYP
jgi:hypothetical protein